MHRRFHLPRLPWGTVEGDEDWLDDLRMKTGSFVVVNWPPMHLLNSVSLRTPDQAPVRKDPTWVLAKSLNIPQYPDYTDDAKPVVQRHLIVKHSTGLNQGKCHYAFRDGSICEGPPFASEGYRWPPQPNPEVSTAARKIPSLRYVSWLHMRYDDPFHFPFVHHCSLLHGCPS